MPLLSQAKGARGCDLKLEWLKWEVLWVYTKRVMKFGFWHVNLISFYHLLMRNKYSSEFRMSKISKKVAFSAACISQFWAVVFLCITV